LRYLEPSKAVLIGASTGGPSHIRKILAALGGGFAHPLIIAQHMGSEYLPSFAHGLALEYGRPVEVVKEGMLCSEGGIYLCDQKCELTRTDKGLTFKVSKKDDQGYNPDINHFFLSVKNLNPRLDLLALLLTGIGEDGAKGMMALSSIGARCIAESSESAIVYGMPMRAKELGIEEVRSLEEIKNIVSQFGRNS